MPLVANWLQMGQDEVLDKFQTLPGSFTDGKGQERFVYVPGTRKDRVLLVAHADTVWRGELIQLGYADGIIFSKRRMAEYERIGKNNCVCKKHGVGIGADDRAGCFIAWNLRDLGHSILITSGEEIGCVASNFIMINPWWHEELSKHNYAIQFDRRGYNDAVFYNVGTNAFAEYIKKETGYKPQEGSYTDIRVLCKKICGVNLSVGYYDEHRPEEKLIVDQMLNTLLVTRDMISKENLPQFLQDQKDLFVYQYPKSSHYDPSKWVNNQGKAGQSERPFVSGRKERKREKKEKGLPLEPDSGSVLVCPHCMFRMSEDNWFENMTKCLKCEKKI
jgi:hypothetical protein